MGNKRKTGGRPLRCAAAATFAFLLLPLNETLDSECGFYQRTYYELNDIQNTFLLFSTGRHIYTCQSYPYAEACI